MSMRVRERDGRRTATTAAGGGAVLGPRRTKPAARKEKGRVGTRQRPHSVPDDEESDSFQSVSETETTDEDDQGSDDSFDDDDDADSYDSFEDRRRVVRPSGRAAAQRVVRAAKQSKRASASAMDKAIERAVERATAKAVDKAVLRVATEAAKKAAAEARKGKGGGRVRRHASPDDVVEVSQPYTVRMHGVPQQPSANETAAVQRRWVGGEWREVGTGRTFPAPQERRLGRTRISYQERDPRIHYSGQRQPVVQYQQQQSRGPVVQNVTVTPGQLRRFEPRSTVPHYDPHQAHVEQTQMQQQRAQLEQTLRGAIMQRQGMNPDMMAGQLFAGIGGEANLVVGTRYNMTPQAAEAIQMLCKAYMCRPVGPCVCVVGLQALQGRYKATVWVDGVECASDTGMRLDGSREDPVLRSVHNAVALAEIQRPTAKGTGMKRAEVYTLEDDDFMDDDMA